MRKERKLIENSGAIGDILGSFFDKNGEIVNNSVTERMFGLKLNDLKNIKEVVILATGSEKIPSIKALASQKFIDHLIIDDNIAKSLASYIQKNKQCDE